MALSFNSGARVELRLTAGALAILSTFLTTDTYASDNLGSLDSKSSARTNLGLGEAATMNAGTDAGELMVVGAFGIGLESLSAQVNLNLYTAPGKFITPATGLTNLPSSWAQKHYAIDVVGGTTITHQTISDGLKTAMRLHDGTAWSAWAQLYTTANPQPSPLPIGIVYPFAHRSLLTSDFVPWDGQLANRADYPTLYAAFASLAIADTDWTGDKSRRGAFSNGNGTTTFRFPDLNGKYSSDPAVFLRGDGGSSAGYGLIQESQNLAHDHNVRMDGDVNGVIPWSDGKCLSTSNSALPGNTGTNQVDSSGGTESRPYNTSVCYASRY